IRRMWKAPIKHATLALSLLQLGCAVTQVTTHSLPTAGLTPPANAHGENVLVLWGTAWRTNQKEVSLRTEVAARAISDYFSRSSRFRSADVVSQAFGRPGIQLSDSEALRYAASTGRWYDKIIFLRVEELGPQLVIYPSPVLWSGGTEVVFRVRMLDSRSAAMELDSTVRWKDGGAFVLKDTRSLEQDLQAALRAVFEPPSESGPPTALAK
ncbi:MAG: hypothetical protein KDA47_14890, partial [Planctomycetales bacterium]|nr:hypothetical protein [Planctomycetales bacterium]